MGVKYPNVVERVIRPNNKEYYEDDHEIWFKVHNTSEEFGISFISNHDCFSDLLERLERYKSKYKRNFWIKKIVWKTPLHAIGYVQWGLRPFMQGMGCDGTTDGPIHLLAKTYCKSLGYNYIDLYHEAYPDDGGDADYWLSHLEDVYSKETKIPKNINPDLILQDLYQINNRSLCEVLDKTLEINWGYYNKNKNKKIETETRLVKVKITSIEY